MSISTKEVRSQLKALADTIAAIHKLDVFTDSLFKDEFTVSGVYLHSTVESQIQFMGTTLAKISGSTFTFWLSVVVSLDDFGFEGPEADMPGRMDDVADSVIAAVLALNLANQDSTAKIRIDFPEKNFHDYNYDTHQGVVQVTLNVLYSRLSA